MKTKWMHWMILPALLGAAFLACAPEAEQEGTVLDEVDVEEAREDFTERTEDQLEALKEDMDELKDELEGDETTADANVQQRIQEWERQYELLEQKLETADAASIEEWRAFEGEVNADLNELRSTYEELSRDLRAAVE